jgi:hypothetical protein
MFTKNSQNNFPKPLDKRARVWYNIYRKKERGKNKMEKVIRICELTGRMTVVATNLTTDEAIALVRERAKADEFGDYRRVVTE